MRGGSGQEHWQEGGAVTRQAVKKQGGLFGGRWVDGGKEFK